MIDALDLGDRYRIDRELGRGGMGVVHRAVHRDLGRVVAIKVLDPLLGADPDSRARFVEEGRLASRVKHPNVVGVLESGVGHDDLLFVVYEFVEGEDLSALVARSGALSVRDALELVIPVLEGIQAIHEAGIVHRDLKPGNIRLGRDGVPRILDFGIARDAIGEKQKTRTGMILGTPGYMAPEILSGHRATTASDVYSTGAILFELLAGRPPFVGDNPVRVFEGQLRQDAPSLREFVPGVSLRLAGTVARALDRDPGARPSVPELVAALRRVLETASQCSTSLQKLLHADAEPETAGRRPVTLAVPSGSFDGPERRPGTMVSSSRVKLPRPVSTRMTSIPARPGAGRSRAVAGLVALLLAISGLAVFHIREPTPAPTGPRPRPSPPLVALLNETVERIRLLLPARDLLGQDPGLIRKRLEGLTWCAEVLMGPFESSGSSGAPAPDVLKASAGAVLGLLRLESRNALRSGQNANDELALARRQFARLGSIVGSSGRDEILCLGNLAVLLADPGTESEPEGRLVRRLVPRLIALRDSLVETLPRSEFERWRKEFDARTAVIRGRLASIEGNLAEYVISDIWAQLAHFAEIGSGTGALRSRSRHSIEPIAAWIGTFAVDSALRMIQKEILMRREPATRRDTPRRTPSPAAVPAGGIQDVGVKFQLVLTAYDFRTLLCRGGPEDQAEIEQLRKSTFSQMVIPPTDRTPVDIVESVQGGLPRTIAPCLNDARAFWRQRAEKGLFPALPEADWLKKPRPVR